MSGEAKQDDGGPAFPVAGFANANGDIQPGSNGMSLRDWFAGMAIPGICKEFYDHEDVLFTSHDIAREAYDIADAMLKARNQ